MKTCPRCKAQKPAEGFHKNRRRRDGLSTWCRACNNETGSRVKFVEAAGTARCAVCKETLPAERFSKNRRSTTGLNYKCRDCRKKTRGQQCPRRKRAHNLGRNYSMVPGEYDRLLESQGGACAVCGRANSGNKKFKHFSIDHDHSTGVVRGLLCSPCNIMLGMSHDSPDTLRKGALYLEAHGR